MDSLTYVVGDRVVIVRAEGSYFKGIPMRDPHPEHIGKKGIIVELDDGMPTIRLDDGTILRGYECWWAKLADGW